MKIALTGLVSCLAGATSAADEPTARYGVAAWLQPIPTLASFAAIGLFPSWQNVFVSDGATYSLSPDLAVGLEAIVLSGSDEHRSPYPTWRRPYAVQTIGGSVLFRLGSGLRFFLAPKLMLAHGWQGNFTYRPHVEAQEESFQVSLGLDLGWEFAFGSFDFAPRFGASIGLASNIAAASGTLFQGPRWLPIFYVAG